MEEFEHEGLDRFDDQWDFESDDIEELVVTSEDDMAVEQATGNNVVDLDAWRKRRQRRA